MLLFLRYRLFTARAARDYCQATAFRFPQSTQSLPFADRHVGAARMHFHLELLLGEAIPLP
eukprot:SAG31_NODE_32494_length_355_cov_0.800781_1_plen_60_part_10